MDEYDIQSRRRGSYNRPTRDTPDDAIDHTDPDTLRTLYHDEGLSLAEIAERSTVTHQSISYHFDKHDIERRNRVEASRYASREEYASFGMASNGYELWRDFWDGSRDRMLVHRLLAVAEYGADEVADKVVHHKNNIRWDNRPDNIELMTPSEHAIHHTEEGDFSIVSGE
jgi:hypothetical protein